MADTKRVRVRVTGIVQGVFFRMETRGVAQSHGVTGWVRNLPDGSVEAVIEGDPKAVDAVVSWCWQGPPHSRVDNVEITEETPTGEFSSFEITY